MFKVIEQFYNCQIGNRLNLMTSAAPNCIKDVLDLLANSGQSGLTLQLFQMVILANQVICYNCFLRKQL